MLGQVLQGLAMAHEKRLLSVCLEGAFRFFGFSVGLRAVNSRALGFYVSGCRVCMQGIVVVGSLGSNCIDLRRL